MFTQITPGRAGAITWWVECLANVCESLGPIPSIVESCVMMHICNPSTPEVGQEDQVIFAAWRGQSLPELCKDPDSKIKQ